MSQSRAQYSAISHLFIKSPDLYAANMSEAERSIFSWSAWPKNDLEANFKVLDSGFLSSLMICIKSMLMRPVMPIYEYTLSPLAADDIRFSIKPHFSDANRLKKNPRWTIFKGRFCKSMDEMDDGKY